MTNAIIYIRVSSKEQLEGTSLESQEKECRKYAKKHGLKIAENALFIEKGESAKYADRPVLQDMLKYVKDNKNSVDTLLIWKIDRLARNLGDYYGIKVALARYEVKIISTTEPIEDDPVGRFLEAILAAAAQFDNEIRAIRTITGMRTRVEQGGWPHQAPYGYIKKQGAYGISRVMIDKEKAPRVTRFLTEFATGKYSVQEAVDLAFKYKITTKTGGKRSWQQTKDMLINPIYAGFVKTKLTEKMKKGRHQALISEDTYLKNVEIVSGTKRPYVLHGDELYPLRKFLVCSRCKKFATASSPRGRSGKYYPKYHCTSAMCKAKVTGKPASEDVEIVHQQFRELLRTLRPLEGVSKLFKTVLLRNWQKEYSDAVDNAKSINQEIDYYTGLRLATLEKYALEKISEKDMQAQINRIDAKLEDLGDDKKDADEYVKDKEQIIDEAMQLINQPDEFWNQASLKIQKAIQWLIFPNGLEYDFGTGFGTSPLSQTHLLIQELNKKLPENANVVPRTGIEPATFGTGNRRSIQLS